MAAKTLATYISELSAVTSLGAGDKLPVLESSTLKYVEGDDLGGGITALTGDVTASGTGSVAATIAAGAVENSMVATGIDAVKLADGTVTNAEFQYLGGVTSDIQTQLNAKQASDADLTTIAGLTPADDDFLQRKAGAWANRTIAQVKTDLGVSTYARYVALLTQTGTDAPVATVLENTLGGTVVWSYSDVGVYLATLAGVFTENKTYCVAGNNTAGFLAFGKSAEFPGADIILLQTTDGNGSPADVVLYQTAVEIRVYP